MKVLMLTPEFLPVAGGIGNYVVEVAKRMPQDVEMTILTPEPRDDPENVKMEIDRDFPGNISVRYLGKAGNAFFHNFAFQIRCGRRLPSIIRDLGIELVHTHSEMPDYFVSPSKIGVPILTTVHTTVQGHYEALKSWKGPLSELSLSEKFVLTMGPLLKTMEDKYYGNLRNYLTVSEWGRRQLMAEKGVDPETIRVIYIGVDSERFNPDKKAEAEKMFSGLSTDKSLRVLYLSRIATRKGIRILERAIPQVLRETNAHFLIAGPGDASKLNLPRDRCTVLGYISKEKIPFLYAFADVFVLPSLYENFPVSILEAMASQTAVLSTDICGIPEMIRNEQNGIMIQPDNSDALVDGMIRLLENDNLRMSLAREARADVTERFNWGNCSRGIRECYRELLA